MIFMIQNLSLIFRKSNQQNILNYTVQKMKIPSWIPSANVTKAAVSCGFGHIYLRNP